MPRRSPRFNPTHRTHISPLWATFEPADLVAIHRRARIVELGIRHLDGYAEREELRRVLTTIVWANESDIETDANRAIGLAQLRVSNLTVDDIVFICGNKNNFMVYHAACEAL